MLDDAWKLIAKITYSTILCWQRAHANQGCPDAIHDDIEGGYVPMGEPKLV